MTLHQDLDPAQLLQGVARRQFGPGIAVAAQDPRRPAAGLLPAERAAVAQAVPSRQREFTAGRSAARAALSEIGVYGQPVLMGEDRAPIWPRNVVGSVSHSETACLAAVGPGDLIQSIGLDLEPATPLDPDLFDSVLTRAEQEGLATLPPRRSRTMAKVIFSAKECAYKCQYPLTGTVLGFHDLEIVLDPRTKTFHAVPAGGGLGSDPENRMTGRYSVLMGHVLTTMILRRW